MTPLRFIGTFTQWESEEDTFGEASLGFITVNIGQELDPQEIIWRLGAVEYAPVAFDATDELKFLAYDIALSSFEEMNLADIIGSGRASRQGFRPFYADGAIRVGIVGYQEIGRFHSESLRQLLDIAVVFEESPPKIKTFGDLINGTTWAGIIVMSAVAAAGGQPILVLWIGGTMVFFGAANGIAKGLERGLAKRVEKAVAGSSKTKRRKK
ncbi:MAG TPA: hypothetical protein VF559_00970 [Caulobacteraceae bacterium]